jgi:hypothetical protein
MAGRPIKRFWTATITPNWRIAKSVSKKKKPPEYHRRFLYPLIAVHFPDDLISPALR